MEVRIQGQVHRGAYFIRRGVRQKSVQAGSYEVLGGGIKAAS